MNDLKPIASAFGKMADSIMAHRQRVQEQRAQILDMLQQPQVLHVERDENGRLCGAYITRGFDAD